MEIFSKTGAVEFYPHFGWVWATTNSTVNGASVFGVPGVYTLVLPLGFVVTIILIIPLGYFNLDDNMIVQKGAFIMACLIFTEWIVEFFIQIGHGSAQHIPVFGDRLAPVFGTIMFNYAMVITVPSWCNEKTHSTRINHAIGTSVSLGTLLFLIIGWIGATAYKIDPDGDILSAINSQNPTIISKLCIYFFPLSVVATSIPIYSIIVRYNLLENNICSKPVANFVAVILPWLVVLPFYCGNGLQDVINWSTLISNGIVNFIIPFLLYVRARTYKSSLPRDDRKDLDAPLDSSIRDEDVDYCFGKITLEGQPPAPPHFVFGNFFDDHSITPIVISATFVVSLTVSVVGILIINLLDSLQIP